MGFNSAFKGLNNTVYIHSPSVLPRQTTGWNLPCAWVKVLIISEHWRWLDW